MDAWDLFPEKWHCCLPTHKQAVFYLAPQHSLAEKQACTPAHTCTHTHKFAYSETVPKLEKLENPWPDPRHPSDLGAA